MNKEKKDKLTPKMSVQRLSELTAKARKYLWLIILIFFVSLYGYIMYKLDGFNSEQPSSTQIGSYLKTVSQPAINPKVVQQLDQLNNNSVSVQALFDQNRQNPFQ